MSACGPAVLFRVQCDEVSGELTYLLADTEAREAVLVDPHSRDLPVLQAMLNERSLRLRWLLRNHDHDNLKPGDSARLARLQAPMVQGRRDRSAAADAGTPVLLASRATRFWRRWQR